MEMTMRTFRRALSVFEDEEDGATAIEYGLIAALIAVALIGSMNALSQTISQTFHDVEVEIDTTG